MEKMVDFVVARKFKEGEMSWCKETAYLLAGA